MMSKLAASVLGKQDQGHADSEEENADTALGNSEQGLRKYTTKIIDHKERLDEDNWTEVLFDLGESTRPLGGTQEPLGRPQSPWKNMTNPKPCITQACLEGRKARRNRRPKKTSGLGRTNWD